jgi:hypothetical protein
MSDRSVENNRKYQALILAGTSARVAYESKLATYSEMSPMKWSDEQFATLDPLYDTMIRTWATAHRVIKVDCSTFATNVSEETIAMFNEESDAQMSRLKNRQSTQSSTVE